VNGGVLENYGTEPARVWLKSWSEKFREDDESEMEPNGKDSGTTEENSGKGGGDPSRRMDS
jgi:hypothetical protein